jgi:rSAM/selenodomain-associated transferase 1
MREPLRIVVLARAPIPGHTKSRLVPRLGPWGAARLQARLIERTLRTARAARIGRIELHGAPRARMAFFVRNAHRFQAALHAQRGRDLGERMQRALARALRSARAALLIGTDCPVISARDLRRAARALLGGADAVLAPAEDGGYGLIGLRRADPRAFEDIAWGQETVYAATRARMDALGWRVRAQRGVWDLDRPEDLVRRLALRARVRGGGP